ncbi:hypothetical protein [Streptomyces sp. NPDC053048]|uniref:hypothetical protein n=1 Tax=Streptomyces sp. NPDC053048 TaxID=3365694 RepID=UPI0037D55BF3
MTHEKKALARLSLAIAMAVGAAVAAVNAAQLATYGVPKLLIASCALSVFACIAAVGDAVAAAVTSTTHRCMVQGCTFKIRVRGVDPGENRRWQEVAASHPVHI